jgi:hypothetical protein
MARRGNDPTGGDKAKVRVLFAEVDGNNESVQEALRTMVSAMSRSVRMVHVKANGELPAIAPQDIDADSVDDALDSDSVAEEPSQSESNAGRKPRGSGPKTDRNAGIALVPDLNFRPEKHPPLREFFAGKAPSSDMEEILLVVYYMQHMMKVSKVGLGHIRTALGDVGKSIPLDLKQTIRNIRGKKAWVKYTELDDITTATAGENHVLHDMGKKG